MNRPPAILLVIVVVLGVLCGANLMLLLRHLAPMIAGEAAVRAAPWILFQRAALFAVTALALGLVALGRPAARLAVTVALLWIALAPVLPVLLGRVELAARPGDLLHTLARGSALVAYVALALWVARVFLGSEAVRAYLSDG